MTKRILKTVVKDESKHKPKARQKSNSLPRHPSPGMKPYTPAERTRIKHWINSIPFAVEQYRRKLEKTAQEYLTAMQAIGKDEE